MKSGSKKRKGKFAVSNVSVLDIMVSQFLIFGVWSKGVHKVVDQGEEGDEKWGTGYNLPMFSARQALQTKGDTASSKASPTEKLAPEHDPTTHIGNMDGPQTLSRHMSL